MLLKFANLLIGALPFGGGAKTFDPLNQHAAIPTAVKDRQHPPFRQAPPETPEIVFFRIIPFGCSNRVDDIAARIQAFS